jgi:glycosyltransferase involved in cell wall biosynthesis
MTEIHVVLPNDIDDPACPSGGNHYDRRVCQGLRALGWQVNEHPVTGAWPHPDANDRARLARVLAARPDHALVLMDGLIASSVPDVLTAHAGRLRLAVLMHMPLVDEGERMALSTAAAVVTTSWWGRQHLLDLYGLPPDRVHAAPPGVDAAPAHDGSPEGTSLLCVAAVTPGKGHDILVRALAQVSDLPWRCTCVGSLERDPAFAAHVRDLAGVYGLSDRITFTGPLRETHLDERYAAADLFVLASRGETYGMVVVEALARAVPVVATVAGGLPEAVGWAPHGRRPGLLVPPGEPSALASAVRRWLTDADLRQRLGADAAARRLELTTWDDTTGILANVLSGITVKASVG